MVLVGPLHVLVMVLNLLVNRSLQRLQTSIQFHFGCILVAEAFQLITDSTSTLSESYIYIHILAEVPSVARVNYTVCS